MVAVAAPRDEPIAGSDARYMSVARGEMPMSSRSTAIDGAVGDRARDRFTTLGTSSRWGFHLGAVN